MNLDNLVFNILVFSFTVTVSVLITSTVHITGVNFAFVKKSKFSALADKLLGVWLCIFAVTYAVTTIRFIWDMIS